MRKLIALIILLTAWLLATLDLTFVRFLSELDNPISIDLDQLMHGNILHILATGAFWQIFPALPQPDRLMILVDVKSFLLTAPLFAAAAYFLACRRRTSFILMSLISLLTTLVPIITALVVLHGNNQPETCGPWVAVMLLGLLYCTGMAIFYAALEVFGLQRWDSQALGQKLICTKSAAPCQDLSNGKFSSIGV